MIIHFKFSITLDLFLEYFYSLLNFKKKNKFSHPKSSIQIYSKGPARRYTYATSSNIWLKNL